jgi:hypothetical protein
MQESKTKLPHIGSLEEKRQWKQRSQAKNTGPYMRGYDVVQMGRADLME